MVTLDEYLELQELAKQGLSKTEMPHFFHAEYPWTVGWLALLRLSIDTPAEVWQVINEAKG